MKSVVEVLQFMLTSGVKCLLFRLCIYSVIYSNVLIVYRLDPQFGSVRPRSRGREIGDMGSALCPCRTTRSQSVSGGRSIRVESGVIDRPKSIYTY